MGLFRGDVGLFVRLLCGDRYRALLQRCSPLIQRWRALWQTCPQHACYRRRSLQRVRLPKKDKMWCRAFLPRCRALLRRYRAPWRRYREYRELGSDHRKLVKFESWLSSWVMSEYLPDEVGHFCRSLLISLALSCGSLLMYMSLFL